MIISVLYSLFFGILNIALYSLLTKSYRVRENVIGLIGVLVLGAVILHSGFFDFDFLMKTKDFFDLLIFSFGIVILYFMSKIQDWFFNKKLQKETHHFFQNFKEIFDFLRYKLIYIMIYIYQCLAIWYVEFR